MGDERAQMVATQLTARGIRDQRVLDALGAVPREAFVPASSRDLAYADAALPIGYGQTISQPYMVALSLELLALRGDEVVLEVGAGSGYAAACLARLAARVVAVERVPELATRAAGVLARLGVANVRVLARDGSRGVPGEGPFDAILVSAAADSLPLRLYHELVEGGRLVAPVGAGDVQRLELVRHTPDGPQVTHSVSCRFVRLITAPPG
jgi:protein-L-isoaspartate(D-aspartate) O-methyltransferase